MDFAGAWSWVNVQFLLEGLLITLELAAWGISLSFLLGLLLGILRFSRIPVLSQLLAVWVEIIRNLPLLLIIFFMYFGLEPLTGLELTKTQAAIAGLVIFESAMISEIIRGGLQSLPKGQIEAARSSGLTYVQTLRYVLVPQALRRMIPPLVSQFISLLKDTSLAIIVTADELMHNMQIAYAPNGSWVFPLLILTALIYFAINFTLSRLAVRLERRLNV